MRDKQGISWGLNRRRMFTVINPLRSADFAIADFSFKKIIFNPLLKVTAGGGFTAAENTGERVCGMDRFRVGEELQYPVKGALINTA